MTSLLILTVGTGTAGKHSDVAAGLARTIDLSNPRLFWLVPSASQKSRPVADLIRESVTKPGAFQAWSDGELYRAIADPDDIHQCRHTLRGVIAEARRQLNPGERIIVNPTSGTKQMSAGATLAALDEEVDQIDFTGGERVDGVVKTGTETVQSFNLQDFLFQRDFRIADELFRHGAFYAAARLLQNYPTSVALQARETALCLHEWQRMNYHKAVSHAAKFSEALRRHLMSLAEADEFSVALLGDLLAGADELLRWGDAEESLARLYRGAEQSAKVRLADALDLRPPYSLERLLELAPPGGQLEEEIRRKARGNTVQIGSDLAWRILEAIQDPMATAFRSDRRLHEGLRRRNESLYGHGQEPVGVHQVHDVAIRLRELLGEHLPAALTCWSAAAALRPKSLSIAEVGA